jgi:hypothetical protein
MALPHKRDPASLGAGRARDTFRVLPTLNVPPISQPLVSLQSDFVARKFRLAPHLGALVAELAFQNSGRAG